MCDSGTYKVADAVMLDAAGTLIAPAEPVAKTYARLASEYGADFDLEVLSRAFVDVFGDMPQLAFSFESDAQLHAMEYQWWRTLVSRVVEQCGANIENFDAYFDRLYEYYANGASWVSYPEVTPVLSRLKAAGYRLVVVSNFDSRLPRILHELEIDINLDAIVYSSRAGSAKPDKAIFQQALDLLGVHAARAIHIGDNVKADFNGARSKGIDSLLIDRKRASDKENDDTISSLNELLTRLNLHLV